MRVGRAPMYTNPVIDADYPDPDAIRVGNEYWMVASSFNLAPGLPLLRSTDLVRWEHVANARPEVLPLDHFALPRRGGGIWAPSLRHHDGRFVIVYPDPDHGIFVTWATDPRGEWSSPRLLLEGIGLIDPCPLWTNDGRAYLVHGWAKSRAGFKNRLTVVEVTSDLTRAIGHPRTVIDGEDLAGFSTLEGPKFYHRDGWYWIFAPAGGVESGWQTVFRARDPFGPYEHRIVLAQGDSDVNGPHQGAWVDTPGGEHWFLHFQDRGPIGRVVHLQPMRWDDDGWPAIGIPGPGGVGQPVRTHRAPEGADADGPSLRLPSADDDFDGPLHPHWSWQANPRAEWSEQPTAGVLRLHAVPDDTGDLRTIGHVIGRRMPGQPVELTTTLDATELTAEGARAGLVLLGEEYAWIGIEIVGGRPRIVARRSSAPGELEEPLAVDIALPSSAIRLRVCTDGDALAWLSIPDDDGGLRVDQPIEIAAGRWIGARVGLFAAAPLGSTPQTVTFSPLHTTLRASPEQPRPVSEAVSIP